MSNQIIYKYPLILVDIQWLTFPDGYEILTLELQNGIPCLWVKHADDPTLPKVEVKIWAYGTGATTKETALKYIGTIIVHRETFVLHFFQTPAGQGK